MTGDSDAAIEPIETTKPDDLAKWTAAPPRIAKRLHTVGFWITGVWLLLVAAYVVADFAAFKALEPNALGDFAAGAAAPLAFLWLVLGFFQQGEELRHSADALWLQGRELQNSVEQQRELVNVTREQLQFDSEMLRAQREELTRNSQPLLQIESGGNMSSSTGMRLYHFYIVNHGKRCTDVRYRVADGRIGKIDVLESGARREFNRELPVSEDSDFIVELSYLDERLIRGSKTIRVQRLGPNFRFEEVAPQAS